MSSVKYSIKKVLEQTTWVTLIFFAIFGLLFVSLILHEYSHQRDLEGLTTSSFTCLLVMPESIGEAFNPLKPTGYYAYNVDYSNAESYEEVNRREIASLRSVISLITSFICSGILQIF